MIIPDYVITKKVSILLLFFCILGKSIFLYSATEQDTELSICVICHDELTIDPVINSQCSQKKNLLHSYHTKCIKKWCDVSHSFVCVLCQQPLSSEVVDRLNAIAGNAHARHSSYTSSDYSDSESDQEERDDSLWQQPEIDWLAIIPLFALLVYSSSFS